jgi:hypothetical protein
MNVEWGTVIQVVTTGILFPLLWRVASSHTAMRDDLIVIKEQLKGILGTHQRFDTEIAAIRVKQAHLELEIERIKSKLDL